MSSILVLDLRHDRLLLGLTLLLIVLLQLLPLGFIHFANGKEAFCDLQGLVLEAFLGRDALDVLLLFVMDVLLIEVHLLLLQDILLLEVFALLLASCVALHVSVVLSIIRR